MRSGRGVSSFFLSNFTWVYSFGFWGCVMYGILQYGGHAKCPVHVPPLPPPTDSRPPVIGQAQNPIEHGKLDIDVNLVQSGITG